MCCCINASKACFTAGLCFLDIRVDEHPASDPVPPDQYEVECASLADLNLNVPCESVICFPSYMVMLLRRKTQLAEWIGENLQDELGFPDKADQRAAPGTVGPRLS